MIFIVNQFNTVGGAHTSICPFVCHYITDNNASEPGVQQCLVPAASSCPTAGTRSWSGHWPEDEERNPAE